MPHSRLLYTSKKMILSLTYCISILLLHAEDGPGVWKALAAKRAALAGYHQEFDQTRTSLNPSKENADNRQLILDVSGNRWLESNGRFRRLFDGESLVQFEKNGDEFTRKKTSSTEPRPYSDIEADWDKASVVEERPCKLPGLDHPCVVIEAPLTKFERLQANNKMLRRIGGTVRLMMDPATGLMVSAKSSAYMEGASGGYDQRSSYTLRSFTVNPPLDAAKFAPPPDSKEVVDFTDWNAARLRKFYAGKPAPDFVAHDLNGKTIRLADLRGKIVLLDFWATWCPPCRADAPHVEKLHQRFGAKNLAILSIAVGDERTAVERYLQTQPKGFPTILSEENDLARPYNVTYLPTYMIINPKGYIHGITEDEKGFAELLSLLKKAGLDVDSGDR